MTNLALSEIQGFVLFGYGKLKHSAYLHATFSDGARPKAWLAEFRAHVCGSTSTVQEHDTRVNVAFTSAGLGRLGLTKAEMANFPREYVQGMGDPLRAVVTGDDPTTWDFGAPDQTPIHALLLLFAKTAEELAALEQSTLERLTNFGGAVVHQDHTTLHDPLREPFGFRDGIAQPHILGSPRAPQEADQCVPTGEFLLGYQNAYQEMPETPLIDKFDLGKNGSYLVCRKLEQDTVGFWKWMLDHAETPQDEASADKLAASIIGRWRSGAPIAKFPNHDPGPSGLTNEFEYQVADPDGQRCPFGAHIRRANPRDMLPPDPKESTKAVSRHRLLRRGRPYGPPPEHTAKAAAAESNPAQRGLVFLALNASFRRQFELIQQTWVNNPKFGGLSDERDPLIGTSGPEGQHFSIPRFPARLRLSGLPSFVRMRGGGYFFVPSRSALEWLAKRA